MNWTNFQKSILEWFTWFLMIHSLVIKAPQLWTLLWSTQKSGQIKQLASFSEKTHLEVLTYPEDNTIKQKIKCLTFLTLRLFPNAIYTHRAFISQIKEQTNYHFIHLLHTVIVYAKPELKKCYFDPVAKGISVKLVWSLCH